MKNTKDDSLKLLVDKIMNENSLDRPSIDFTTNVMSKVLSLQDNKTTVYKPLISKSTWIIILITFLSMFIYLYLTNEIKTSVFSNELNFDFLYNSVVIKACSNISFSKISMYAMAFVTTMFLIQIPILKILMDKRLKLQI